MLSDTGEPLKFDTEILSVINALLDTTVDENEAVAVKTMSSLKKISKQYFAKVLKLTCKYREKNSKIDTYQRKAILNLIEQICIENYTILTPEHSNFLIGFSLDEIFRNLESPFEVQTVISHILVLLSQNFPISVIQSLISKIDSNSASSSASNLIIIYTLGLIANSNSNAIKIMPFMDKILENLVSLMALMRSDFSKEVLARSFGQFCDCIYEYDQNAISCPTTTTTTTTDNDIQIETLQHSLNVGYNILIQSWILSRDLKVMDEVFYAIGLSFPIISRTKMTEQVPKLIPLLLSISRKIKNNYHLTRCLNSVIKTIVKLDPTILNHYLDSILYNICDQLCVDSDLQTHTEIVRNHNEILRCYECLAVQNFEKIFGTIINLSKGYEKDRVKMLIITAHLINSINHQIQPKIDHLMTLLRTFLTDTSPRIKRALIKVIMALASHEYLLDDENKIFIDFLLKLSSSKVSDNNSDKKMESELLDMSDNCLYLLTTTVKPMENFLWRTCLTSFLQKEYFRASFTILKCLQFLANKKFEEVQNLQTDVLDRHIIDVPSPESIMVRCLMLLLKPGTNSENTQNILNFLTSYSVFIKRHLYALWKKALDQLAKNVDENHILGFLKLTFLDVDESQWSHFVALKICEQILYHDLTMTEKLCLLKLLAVTLNSIDDEEYVNEKLDLIFSIKNFNGFSEIQSCAEAIGIISRRHCHLVLEKLKNFRREELVRKSKFFNLNFMLIKEGKYDGEMDKTRLLIIACYEFIIKSIPVNEIEKIESTIETEIIDWIFMELKLTKDFLIRKVSMKSLNAISETIINTNGAFRMSQELRKEIIFFILNLLQLHSGAEFIELFPIILTTSISLIKIDSNFTQQERYAIMIVVFENIYNASSIYCNLTKTGDNSISFGTLKLSPVVSDCFDKLSTLIKELLLQALNPETLDDVVTLLETWMQKRKAEQRLPAIQTLRDVLQCYFDNMKFVYEAPSKFSQTGYIIGKLIPRSSDSNPLIRKSSLHCIDLVLSIASKFETHFDGNECLQDMHLKFHTIEQTIESDDQTIFYSNVCELADILSTYLPGFQIVHFVESLIDSLTDYDSSSSNGCAIVLHVFLKNRGAKLCNNASNVFKKLLITVEKISCNQTRNLCTKAVNALVHHHLKAVMSVLLSQQLPYDPFICDCWMSLSQDGALTLNVFEYLKHIFDSELLFNEEKKTENIATIKPLSAVCALRELFRNSQIYESIMTQYSDFFSLLLIVMGSYINLAPPSQTPSTNSNTKSTNKLVPMKIAIDCFNSFLECTRCDKITSALYDHKRFTDSQHPVQLYSKMVQGVAETVCLHNSIQLATIVESLSKYATSNYESQRLTVASFLIEIVQQNGNKIDLMLLDNVMQSLINYHTDSSPLLRLLSLRGLHNFYSIHSNLADKYYSEIVDFFLQSLDEPDSCFHEFDSSIPVEALNGLLLIFDEEMSEMAANDIRMIIAIRIRAFFTKENTKLRSKSIQLFGILAKSLQNASKLELFIEQVKCNFICFLLHLNDTDFEVIQSCKLTLINASVCLGSPEISSLIENQLSDDINFVYEDFIADLVKNMINEMADQLPLFVMNILNFTKSPWNKVRLNSLILLGQLLSNGSEDLVHQLQIDLVCKHLLKFLNDSDPVLKAEAIQTVGFLFKHKIP